MAEDDEPLEDEPEEEEPEEPGAGDGTEELSDEEEGTPGDEGPTMADVERWLAEKGGPMPEGIYEPEMVEWHPADLWR